MPPPTEARSNRPEPEPHVEPMSVVNTNRPQRRRAVYVHVSDLTSAYDIDHAMLEEELVRAKRIMDEGDVKSRALGGVPTELDTSYPKKRLQPPRHGNNMVVLVGDVRVVVDKNRVDGSRVRLAEVEVGDETGTVSLRARDDQIDMLEEISDKNGAAVLRNCTLELYQGKHIRLAVTKWGKLSSYPDQVPSTPPPPSKINRDRNFSKIDLSLVASELVPVQAPPQSDPHQDSDTVASQRTTGSQGSRSFQSGHPTQQRRGHHRPGRGKMGSPGNMPSQFPDSSGQNPRRPYQGSGLGYGLGAPPYYAPVQQQQQQPPTMGNLPRQQQHQQQQQVPPPPHQPMMYSHHPYDIQRRQMHAYPAQDDHQLQQQHSLQPGSPMRAPAIHNAASFDTSFSLQAEVPIPPPPPGSSQQQHYMMPIHGQTGPPPHSPHLQHQTSNVSQPRSSRSESPLSPNNKMNPQAATFDPTAGRFHQPPSS